MTNETEFVALSFRVPATLRAKLEEQAKAEERTLSSFLRFHIGRLLDASEEEAATMECECQTDENNDR
jgi:predicted DNA-binding ribbon-helix-helix protein